MFEFITQHQQPDFAGLQRVLLGQQVPDKVYFAEIGWHDDLMRPVVEKYMGRPWIPQKAEPEPGSDPPRRRWVDARQSERRLQMYVDFFLQMGYDYLIGWVEWQNLPEFRTRVAKDTAGESAGDRTWAEQAGGIIKSFEDFDRIDWPGIKSNPNTLDLMRKLLPKGMKIVLCDELFLRALEWFFGFEDLFIFSVEKPDLVAAFFQTWGQKVYDAYAELIHFPEVGAIFHADDMGFKTGTLMRPDFYREHVFPWLKKCASLAHENGKMFWLHSCGSTEGITEDLIHLGVDAFHAFEDVIRPVGDFLHQYGDRVAALGGIDMDKIVRLNEKQLRAYVRDTLDACMPGRYALGTGNTATNFVPVENYLTMLDEGRKWQR